MCSGFAGIFCLTTSATYIKNLDFPQHVILGRFHAKPDHPEHRLIVPNGKSNCNYRCV